MATLQMSENSKAANGRSRKPLPSVDLTAMVDLAFLLITFFMLTTSLSKMSAMDVAKPVDAIEQQHYPASRSMTILLGKDNKLLYYPCPIKWSLTVRQDSAIEQQHYPASRSMTILLGKDNKAVYYFGEAKLASMNVVDLKRIGAELIAGKAMVAKTHSTPKDKVMLVIIKPTEGSIYKNFVDVIDEMSVNGIVSYAIDDDFILDEEKQFMKAKSL